MRIKLLLLIVLTPSVLAFGERPSANYHAVINLSNRACDNYQEYRTEFPRSYIKAMYAKGNYIIIRDEIKGRVNKDEEVIDTSVHKVTRSLIGINPNKAKVIIKKQNLGKKVADELMEVNNNGY